MTSAASRRSASSSRRSSTAREYGLNWNAPLPKGGFALANDVKLLVDLELAQALAR